MNFPTRCAHIDMSTNIEVLIDFISYVTDQLCRHAYKGRPIEERTKELGDRSSGQQNQGEKWLFYSTRNEHSRSRNFSYFLLEDPQCCEVHWHVNSVSVLCYATIKERVFGGRVGEGGARSGWCSVSCNSVIVCCELNLWGSQYLKSLATR